MSLADVLKAVEAFSPDELHQLRAHIQKIELEIEPRLGTLDLDTLLSSLAEIRAGLTDEEFAEIERAMN